MGWVADEMKKYAMRPEGNPTSTSKNQMGRKPIGRNKRSPTADKRTRIETRQGRNPDAPATESGPTDVKGREAGSTRAADEMKNASQKEPDGLQGGGGHEKTRPQ